MEKLDILNKLTVIFRTIFNDQSLILENEMTANDINNWDSLTHMILITEIEKLFMIKFKLKELNKMRNIGDMIDLIYSKI
jgi:acyl carrier protein